MLDEVAGKKGFNMLNISIYDVDVLRAAQKEPEKYGDVIVRVWGYSARFIDLSPDMQEHVDARTIGQ
jgi:formate C-acetyltransferase